MTETAFTPGPWYVTEREDMLRIREEGSDYIIATTDDGGHPELEIFDYATQEANARLIAAAPAMFEALRTIAENDTDGLHMHTPQAMQAIARKVLVSAMP